MKMGSQTIICGIKIFEHCMCHIGVVVVIILLESDIYVGNISVSLRCHLGLSFKS